MRVGRAAVHGKKPLLEERSADEAELGL